MTATEVVGRILSEGDASGVFLTDAILFAPR